MKADKKDKDVVGIIAFSEERCIMCGAVIPEGRQICMECETRVMQETVKEKN